MDSLQNENSGQPAFGSLERHLKMSCRHEHPEPKVEEDSKSRFFCGPMSSCLESYSKWVRSLHAGLVRYLLEPIMMNSARYPLMCIVATLFLTVGMACWALKTGSLKTNFSVYETAVPQDMYALKQAETTIAAFGLQRTTDFIMEHLGKDGQQQNVLSAEYMKVILKLDRQIESEVELWHMQNGLLRQQRSGKKNNAPEVIFETMVHAAWGMESKSLEALEEVLYEPSWAVDVDSYIRYSISEQLYNFTKLQIPLFVNASGSSEASAPVTITFLGQPNFAPNDTTALLRRNGMGSSQLPLLLVQSAPAVQTRLMVTDRNTGIPVDQLEHQLVNMVRNFQESVLGENTNMRLSVYNAVNLDDDLVEPLYRDLPLIYGTFAIMVVFCCVFMSRWTFCNDEAYRKEGRRIGFLAVDSHGLLGLGAAVTVALSVVTGYSFCGLLGFPITGVTQILPFVLFGIGLDDSFILVGALRQVSASTSTEQLSGAHTDTNKTQEQDGKARGCSFEYKLSRVIHIAGPSVVVTSLTDCLAFACGAMVTTLPYIRWFCFYAVTCIGIDFIFQITFFVALMALDNRRIKADRYDFAICFKKRSNMMSSIDELESSRQEILSAQAGRIHRALWKSVVAADESTYFTVNEVEVELEQEETSMRTEIAVPSVVREAPPVEQELSSSVMETYGRLLMRSSSKIVVVVFFTALFIVGSVLASRITPEFDLTTLMASDSMSVRFTKAREAYFEADVGLPYVFVQGTDIDWTNSSVRSHANDFLSDLKDASKGSMQLPTNVWWQDFELFLEENSDLIKENAVLADTLVLNNAGYEMYLLPSQDPSMLLALELFLAKPDTVAKYGKDILRLVMEEDDDQATATRLMSQEGIVGAYGYDYYLSEKTNMTFGPIASSRTRVSLTFDSDDWEGQVDFLQRQRELAQGNPLNRQAIMDAKDNHNWVGSIFLFESRFPLYEHYRLIPKEMMWSWIATTGAIGVITFLFFPHPAGAVLSVLMVTFVNIEMLGVLQAASMKVNTVTVLLLIMAVGLVIDYCLHIVLSVLRIEAFETPEDRVIQGLKEVGSGVMHGGCSTLLGVMALSLSSGTVFRSFFLLFTSTILVGLAHGLILLPVLLSLVLRGKKMTKSSRPNSVKSVVARDDFSILGQLTNESK